MTSGVRSMGNRQPKIGLARGDTGFGGPIHSHERASGCGDSHPVADRYPRRGSAGPRDYPRRQNGANEWAWGSSRWARKTEHGSAAT
jgi:hypothetical protein